jgi:DedD protein
MASSQDTEITLGTSKLLGLFFGLVAICAVFFALGYMLGRKSDAALSAAAIGGTIQSAPSGVKPGGSTNPAPSMTFYKAVEQKDASAQLTPASEDGNTGNGASGQGLESQATESENTKAAIAATPSDPTAAAPAAGYLVQVAAVSKQDDAEALVDALKKKQYPAFVAANSAMDKLFRVQVGPFFDIKAAESMRAHLVDDGYNPILKK